MEFILFYFGYFKRNVAFNFIFIGHPYTWLAAVNVSFFMTVKTVHKVTERRGQKGSTRDSEDPEFKYLLRNRLS
jgi:hypothetical protein